MPVSFTLPCTTVSIWVAVQGGGYAFRLWRLIRVAPLFRPGLRGFLGDLRGSNHTRAIKIMRFYTAASPS